MKKAAVLLAEGFEEVEAVTPIDFLRRAGIEVVVAGVGDLHIKGARGITVLADTLVDDLPEDLDAVICPGGLPGSTHLSESPAVIELIRNMFSRGRLVGAICAAPAVVLGTTGILEGRKCTGYPGTTDNLSGCSVLDQRVVVDENLITSQGAGTAAEFSHALISYLAGEESADKVSKATLQKS